MTDQVPRSLVERALELEAAAPRPAFKDELWDDLAADWRGLPRSARVVKSSRRRSPLPFIALAAAVAAVIVLVVNNSGDDYQIITDSPPVDSVRTGPGPIETAPIETSPSASDLAASTTSEPTVVTSVPGVPPSDSATGSTVLTTTDATTATTASTAEPTATSVRPAGSPFLVSYQHIPEPYQPTPFVAMDLSANTEYERGLGVAVSESGAVFVHPSSGGAFVISATGESTFVPLDVFPSYPIAGPGDVLYGIVYGDQGPESALPHAQMVAVALSGPKAGTVVSAVSMNVNPYIELPGPIFGHGPDGVIDRRYGETIMAYVDPDGQPLKVTQDFPVVRLNADETAFDVDGVSLPIEIIRHPDAADLYSGEVPPSPSAAGGAVYSTWVGPAIAPEADYGIPSVPVVIVVHPDGTGTLVRVPDDWFVAGSDVWGTLLGRWSDISLEDPTLGQQLELAWVIADGVAVPSAS